MLANYHRAGNFCLEKFFAFFAQVRCGRNFFFVNYFTQWKFCHAENFTHTGFIRGCQAVLVVSDDHQSAVLPGIQNLFFLNQCSLVWCPYCHNSTLHLGFCPILQDPYRRSYRLLPSQRPMLLWTACSKLRPRKLRSERSIVCTVHACEYGTSTFIDTWDYVCSLWYIRYSGLGMACSFKSSTHYFLVSNSCCGQN